MPARARHKVDLLVDAGIRTFVDLTTPADRLDPLRAARRRGRDARRLDVRHVSFPIPDLGRRRRRRVRHGDDDDRGGARPGGVYVHCWGGIGRTGTVIGCVLADEGLDYDEIIERLDRCGGGAARRTGSAPETTSQREVIRRRTVTRRLEATGRGGGRAR